MIKGIYLVLLTAEMTPEKKNITEKMAKYIEVVSLVTSDEGPTELVERKKTEVISLVTSEEEDKSTSTTDYDSDEEYWRQRKKNCTFILWECSDVVSMIDKCYVFFFRLSL